MNYGPDMFSSKAIKEIFEEGRFAMGRESLRKSMNTLENLMKDLNITYYFEKFKLDIQKVKIPMLRL